MSYKVLEVHVAYKNGMMEEMAVLWVSNEKEGWVRASYATSKPIGGYKFLTPNDTLSTQLVQTVAGQGMNLPDEKKEKLFPGKRKWER